jgi:FCD domain
VVPTNFLTLFPDHEKHSLDEHDELLQAIADHDSERARSIAERHVLEAGRSLAAWLDQHISDFKCGVLVPVILHVWPAQSISLGPCGNAQPANSETAS